MKAEPNNAGITTLSELYVLKASNVSIISEHAPRFTLLLYKSNNPNNKQITNNGEKAFLNNSEGYQMV